MLKWLIVRIPSRRDVSAATSPARRMAYERAERRRDPDAAFNLGVLLYEAGDLEGAEAAWRRSVAPGHSQAGENLRFLLQRHGATSAREAAGVGGTTDSASRG